MRGNDPGIQKFLISEGRQFRFTHVGITVERFLSLNRLPFQAIQRILRRLECARALGWTQLKLAII
jgi:hypothetical protein